MSEWHSHLLLLLLLVVQFITRRMALIIYTILPTFFLTKERKKLSIASGREFPSSDAQALAQHCLSGGGGGGNNWKSCIPIDPSDSTSQKAKNLCQQQQQQV